MSETRPPATPSREPVAPAVRPDASKALTTFVMIVAILYFGRDVLVPVTVAMLLAFVLAPLVNLLGRLRLGRVTSVLLGVTLSLAVILAVGGVIGTQIGDLAGSFPRYAATLEAKVSSIRQFAFKRLAHLAAGLGEGIDNRRFGQVPDYSPQIAPNPVSPVEPPSPQPSTPMQLANRFIAPVLVPFATAGIVFIVAVFVLLQREDLRDRAIRLVGSDDLHRTTLAIDDAARRLSRYFLIQLSINTVFGIIIGIGLLVIGVPNPALWGILAALLRFVPYLGTPIAAALPMALAAAVEPGWSMVLWTAALFGVLEAFTGQAIEPTVYGLSTGLSPFAVIVAAIFWSWLWGPIGLILSTPLTLCLVVIGRHVHRLDYLDILLGNRAALSPVASFHQRILAGDVDEAQHHAELILTERSLSTYYDEVVIKGLRLASTDALRGALNLAQLDRLRSTAMALIRGLNHHNDEHPPTAAAEANTLIPLDDEEGVPETLAPLVVPEGGLPEAWKSPNAVLCVAGRGPLDAVAAAMLLQLLNKHGMNGRTVAYEDVSRESVEALDVAGAVMTCVSYLDIGGAPAHLKYLIERLRQRLPNATPILIGLWPLDDAGIKDELLKAEIGADYLAVSLSQTVTTCLRVALSLREPISGKFSTEGSTERMGRNPEKSAIWLADTI
jgi:predicted PurR-regulated permease PerM